MLRSISSLLSPRAPSTRDELWQLPTIHQMLEWWIQGGGSGRSARSYPCPVVAGGEDTIGDDSVIVAISNDQPPMARADWLRLLAADGSSDVDAQAAELVRELRERCEGDDARRP